MSSAGDTHISTTLQKYFDRAQYDKWRSSCLEERQKIGPGKSVEMNRLYKFWCYHLREQFDQEMYNDFKKASEEDLANNYRYGLECLFRFYSYGLEISYNKQLYEDFEFYTLQDYQSGHLYGLEKFWAYHFYKGYYKQSSSEYPVKVNQQLKDLLNNKFRSLNDFRQTGKEFDSYTEGGRTPNDRKQSWQPRSVTNRMASGPYKQSNGHSFSVRSGRDVDASSFRSGESWSSNKGRWGQGRDVYGTSWESNPAKNTRRAFWNNMSADYNSKESNSQSWTRNNVQNHPPGPYNSRQNPQRRANASAGSGQRALGGKKESGYKVANARSYGRPNSRQAHPSTEVTGVSISPPAHNMVPGQRGSRMNRMSGSSFTASPNQRDLQSSHTHENSLHALPPAALRPVHIGRGHQHVFGSSAPANQRFGVSPGYSIRDDNSFADIYEADFDNDGNSVINAGSPGSVVSNTFVFSMEIGSEQVSGGDVGKQSRDIQHTEDHRKRSAAVNKATRDIVHEESDLCGEIGQGESEDESECDATSHDKMSDTSLFMSTDLCQRVGLSQHEKMNSSIQAGGESLDSMQASYGEKGAVQSHCKQARAPKANVYSKQVGRQYLTDTPLSLNNEQYGAGCGKSSLKVNEQVITQESTDTTGLCGETDGGVACVNDEEQVFDEVAADSDTQWYSVERRKSKRENASIGQEPQGATEPLHETNTPDTSRSPPQHDDQHDDYHCHSQEHALIGDHVHDQDVDTDFSRPSVRLVPSKGLLSIELSDGKIAQPRPGVGRNKKLRRRKGGRNSNNANQHSHNQMNAPKPSVVAA